MMPITIGNNMHKRLEKCFSCNVACKSSAMQVYNPVWFDSLRIELFAEIGIATMTTMMNQTIVGWGCCTTNARWLISLSHHLHFTNCITSTTINSPIKLLHCSFHIYFFNCSLLNFDLEHGMQRICCCCCSIMTSCCFCKTTGNDSYACMVSFPNKVFPYLCFAVDHCIVHVTCIIHTQNKFLKQIVIIAQHLIWVCHCIAITTFHFLCHIYQTDLE